MSKKTKVFMSLALIVAAGALAFKIGQIPLSKTLVRHMANQNVGFDKAANLSDGLHVFICGAGSPMPDPVRSGPCTGIVAGEQVFVVDTGTGGARNLGRMGFPLGRVDAVLLTHLHSDHMDGLGELLLQTWINGSRTTPTPVLGPKGTAEVVEGFNAAYRIDSTYRYAHHGNDVANPAGFGGDALEFSIGGISETIFDENGVKISAVLVQHSPVEPSVGYRFDYKGRSVTLSGDTTYHPGLVAVAKGSDVLLHEALNVEMVETLRATLEKRGLENLAKVMVDIQDYHASPVDAARAAAKADVGELILNHIVPPLPSKLMHPWFLEGTKAEYSGPISIAEDGQIISLPAASSTIEHINGFRF